MTEPATGIAWTHISGIKGETWSLVVGSSKRRPARADTWVSGNHAVVMRVSDLSSLETR